MNQLPEPIVLRRFGDPPWIFAGFEERGWWSALMYAHTRQDRARDAVKALWHRGRAYCAQNVDELDTAETTAIEAEHDIWAVWNGDLGTIGRLDDERAGDPSVRITPFRKRTEDLR